MDTKEIIVLLLDRLIDETRTSAVELNHCQRLRDTAYGIEAQTRADAAARIGALQTENAHLRAQVAELSRLLREAGMPGGIVEESPATYQGGGQ